MHTYELNEEVKNRLSEILNTDCFRVTKSIECEKDTIIIDYVKNGKADFIRVDNIISFEDLISKLQEFFKGE